MSETVPIDYERVKESDGDLVLDYDSRVGARPYARYVDGEWDLMSLTYVPTPRYGEPEPEGDHPVPYNTEVHTVDLEPDPDDWDEDELREIAEQPRYPEDDVEGWPGVQVISYEESPFAHRDEIPARDEIIREMECPECGDEFRQYLPDPFEKCPHCESELEDRTVPRDYSSLRGSIQFVRDDVERKAGEIVETLDSLEEGIDSIEEELESVGELPDRATSTEDTSE